MYHKAFLRDDGRCSEAVSRKSVGQPIPANVGGEVLLAGAVEQGVGLGVLKVGAGGTGGVGVAEFGESFAVVEGDEETVPGLGGDFSGEGGGGEWGVELVAFGREFGRRKSIKHI